MRRLYKYPLALLTDTVFIATAIGLSLLIKGADLRYALDAYVEPIGIFYVVWVLGSIILRKYDVDRIPDMHKAAWKLLKVDVILFLVVTFVVFLLQQEYSRGVLIGAAGFTVLFELMAMYAYKLDEELGDSSLLVEKFHDQPKLEEEVPGESVEELSLIGSLRDSIVEEVGKTAFIFFRGHLHSSPGQTLFVSTTTKFNIDTQPGNTYRNIVNLHRSNDILRINKFFESVNDKLPAGGLFLCCVETAEQRKARLLKKYPPLLNYIYYPLDYVFKRVFPKLPLTKNLYFFITRGNNRVLSRAEALGRLYSCGFEVIGEENSNGRLCIAAKKMKTPAFDMHPTYGPLVKLRRHGRNGKIIGVYKMRTMYPYSEYLQEYVFKHNNLADGGKFKDDFRITGVGRVMRKFWLDELPMLLNWVKGDMKLVGVRPLSRHYFNLYTEELRERRIKHTPGLVPPFYVDLPQTLEEVMESELRYLDAYERAPFRTDWRYFWAAMKNIFIHRARSK
jgi:lipopolysaccharide/colanic/teichoic acid biosynthesis glycosyltransferase